MVSISNRKYVIKGIKLSSVVWTDNIKVQIEKNNHEYYSRIIFLLKMNVHEMSAEFVGFLGGGKVVKW